MASAADLPPWTDFYTQQDLLAATKVFQLYADNEDYLKHASHEPQIARLFALARTAMVPNKEELKDKRRRKKYARKEADSELLAVSGIRKMRKVKMVGYTGGSIDMPMPPRIGTVEANAEFAAQDDQKLIQQTQQMQHTAATTPAAIVAGDADAGGNDETVEMEGVEHVNAVIEEEQSSANAAGEPPKRKLTYNRACHICGAPFRDLHHFYDQMCPPCAAFNFTKRFSTADMHGRVCIVTGARVKIGYCIALKLLRMGATVIVTTRFPHDAAQRFAREADASEFGGRVAVYGLDFRDVPMLHHFCRHVQERYKRLDVIINNAAQTVRKPPAFYEHLMKGEEGRVPEHVARIVDVVDVYRARQGGYLFEHASAGGGAGGVKSVMDTQAGGDEVVAGGARAAAAGGSNKSLALAAAQATAHLPDVNASAALSQLPLIPSDHTTTTTTTSTSTTATASAAAAELFPPGLYDRDDQQLDLRRENSWTMELGEISSVEMMECHVINTFAPWVLVSELKSLMQRTRSPVVDGAAAAEDGEWDKFIVNVSAMEGQFYRNKTIFHPHTNMAKAALNMMTRTASAGFAAVNIFMTAVDTGWITDEQPVDQHYKRESAPPPLDEWDAAMRVLDPVLVGVNGEQKLWGCFLKNYRSTRW
ncbi:hypothetical protein HDU87_004493 [Geranomyces variabilis]|uniref:Oxidoreductase n=1 Tax=Geranomyces variabilis TaxID=109894 RepID=A0AAD5XLZ0_9FUNG|nr:hypothetical protein HDU87_004493 [Geranomyces variabilis]